MSRAIKTDLHENRAGYTANTLEKSETTLEKGCSTQANYQLCSRTWFNFTD